MIRRAAVDYVLYHGHKTKKMSKLGEDAHSWIFNPSQEDDASFDNVCTNMNLDPTMVRDKIKTLSVEYVRTLRGLDFEDG